MFEKTEYEIKYEAGDAKATGTEKSVEITLPKYEHVGIFTYKITESDDNQFAGVDYDGNTLYLKVTVIEQNGEIRVASLRYANAENGAKDEGFKNTYSAGDLSIHKNVTGNMGEKDRYFKVTVTLTGDTTKTYLPFNVTGGTYTQNPATISVGTSVDFYIKHDETIKIVNIPYDVTYTVVEEDCTDDGYAAAVYTDDDTDDETEKTIDDAADLVTITNTKGAEVDTGISVDSIPYIAMLGVVAIGGTGFLVSKKRRSED